MTMTNEELFYLLQKFWPGTINGTHYLTGHRLDTEGKQLGEAFLQYWRLSDPQPSRGQLLTWWGQYRDEIQATIAGVHHRWERNERLLKADALVYRAEDAGDDARLEAARRYRQALRDVPQQAGFPRAFTWPVPPEDDEVRNVAARDAVLIELAKTAEESHRVFEMPADLLPPVTLLSVHADGTTGPAVPPPEEPMRAYGNLETRTVMKATSDFKPIVPVIERSGEAMPVDDWTDYPHSPGYEESIPINQGISPPPPVEPEPAQFQPSPQPDFMIEQDAQNAAEIALEDDPAAKLRAFLSANPDVVTYIEESTPVTPPVTPKE
ncbi:hypothetical protein BG58_33040 [Caballeronia jiangsuensis]|nr:hypothetical protein BG58_33040 [Caballeronia jiangsuensis]